MAITTIYGVVLRHDDGGEQLKSFDYEEEALVEAENLVEDLKRQHIRGCSVFVSELEYDEDRDLIVSDHLVDGTSRVIYEG